MSCIKYISVALKTALALRYKFHCVIGECANIYHLLCFIERDEDFLVGWMLINEVGK